MSDKQKNAKAEINAALKELRKAIKRVKRATKGIGELAIEEHRQVDNQLFDLSQKLDDVWHKAYDSLQQRMGGRLPLSMLLPVPPLPPPSYLARLMFGERPKGKDFFDKHTEVNDE